MICEGCIKQDTCKYRDKVKDYEWNEVLEEPLEVTVRCKYKQTYPPLPGCNITTDNPVGADWDTVTYPDGNVPFTYTS